MKIKFVPRNQVKVRKSRSSKFRPLLDALDQLKVNGDAVEVGYITDKELISLRNAVYGFSRESGKKIKSGKDAHNKKIYFYRIS